MSFNRIFYPTAIFSLLMACLYIRQQSILLEQANVVYKNPEKRVELKVVKVAGPVRIVTRTIRTPEREETIREEMHGPVVTTSEKVETSKPVPLALALKPPHQGRWLVGARLLEFAPKQVGSYELLVGRSLAPQLDVLVGARLRADVQTSLAVVLRF